MMLYIEVDSSCLEDYWDGEQYGDWYQSLDFSIKSVHLQKPEYATYEEFEVPFDVVSGDEVHILWMMYSSGDSFGQSDGNHELIWIFKDKEVAKAAEISYTNIATNESINNNCDHDSSMITIVIDSGEEMKLSNPAWGYFENVSSINLQTFKVE